MITRSVKYVFNSFSSISLIGNNDTGCIGVVLPRVFRNKCTLLFLECSQFV